MAFNASQKLAGNIEAIQIALQWDGNRKLNSSELDTLRGYAGFGGIKAVLFPAGSREAWVARKASEADLRLYPKIMELHTLLDALLSPKECAMAVDSLRKSTLTAYYTPDLVPRALYTALRENGIVPKNLYEPSAGAGIFIEQAWNFFPGIDVNAVEKDFLTGKVLAALCSDAKVQICGLEETSASENGRFDLITSNIPFGNMSVFDPAFAQGGITSKIHNYFFAKGLDKLADGGIMAYLTTDAFLNSPDNELARKYLFTTADFISLAVMPDNLMKDSANVEAPSLLLVVQKNEHKNTFSETEQLLLETVEQENGHGKFHQNAYVARHQKLVMADEIGEGTNQYGQPCRMVWQNGPLEDIFEGFTEQLTSDFEIRLDKQKLQSISTVEATDAGNFTFLPVPEDKVATISAQLGLFERAPNGGNRAQAYLTDLDSSVIEPSTASLVSTIRTTAKPDHESLVLLTAKGKTNNRYLYKLYSNVAEVAFPGKWLTGIALAHELKALSARLKNFGYDFRYSGDNSLEAAFELGPDQPKAFQNPLAFYANDTLVIHEGEVGLIDGRYFFEPFEEQKELPFYQAYVLLRDSYFLLFAQESETLTAMPGLRNDLNRYYDVFNEQFGELNKTANRAKILNDPAFGVCAAFFAGKAGK
jgi:hypothetical protein